MKATDNVLFRWIQSTLQFHGVDLYIDSLNDLQDGTILYQLVRVLIPYRSLNVSVEASDKKIVVLNRIQSVLDAIAKDGIHLTCSATDFYDGDEKMIFGFLWVLALHYQVEHQAMIDSWVKNTVNKYVEQSDIPSIDSIDKCFQNGIYFCCLVNAIRPGLIDSKKFNEDSNELMKLAFNVSEKEFGIPRLLEPDWINEHTLVLYLSYFFKKFKDEPLKESTLQSKDDIIKELQKKVELLTEELEKERNSRKKDSSVAELKYQSLRKDTETKTKKIEKKLRNKKKKVDTAEAKLSKLMLDTDKELNFLKESQVKLNDELRLSKDSNNTMNRKLKELTLKMPIYLRNPENHISPPKQNVTLVFTDVQSSTTQWEQEPDAMATSLAMHNELMRELMQKHSGYEVKTEGDAFMIAFSSPINAIKWCVECQERLLLVKWPEDIYNCKDSSIEEVDGIEIYRGLRVRMGVHTGNPKAQEDPVTGRMDYFGPVVNRAARIEGKAQGGQIVISGETKKAIDKAIQTQSLNNIEIIELGFHKLKGLQTDTQLYQLLPVSLNKRKFPLYIEEKNEPSNTSSNPEEISLEIEALVQENQNLKKKIVEMETTVREAMAKAELLRNTLEEMHKVMPESFTKQFIIANKNLKNIMESNTVFNSEIEEAKKRNLKLAKLHKGTLFKLDAANKRCKELERELNEYKSKPVDNQSPHRHIISRMTERLGIKKSSNSPSSQPIKESHDSGSSIDDDIPVHQPYSSKSKDVSAEETAQDN